VKNLSIIIIVAIFALSFGSLAIAGEGHDCKGHHDHDSKAPKSFDSAQKAGTKATCPVSDEEVTIDDKTISSEYKGKHVYFCCEGCKTKFDADPDKYLKDK